MRTKALAAPYLLWMGIFTVVPLAIVAWFAFTDSAGMFTLANIARVGTYVPIFLKSIWLSILASVICLIIGCWTELTAGIGGAKRRISSKLTPAEAADYNDEELFA